MQDLAIKAKFEPQIPRFSFLMKYIDKKYLLDLFCFRLGLPIDETNSLWVVGAIPLWSRQLSDSLPFPKCSRLLERERDIDEPCKSPKQKKRKQKLVQNQ